MRLIAISILRFADSGRGVFKVADMTELGETIVEETTDPARDAALALLARGHDSGTRFAMFRASRGEPLWITRIGAVNGKTAAEVEGTVGEFAEVVVKETAADLLAPILNPNNIYNETDAEADSARVIYSKKD